MALRQRLQPYPGASSMTVLRSESSSPRSQLRSWLTQRIQAVQLEISQIQSTKRRPGRREPPVRRAVRSASPPERRPVPRARAPSPSQAQQDAARTLQRYVRARRSRSEGFPNKPLGRLASRLGYKRVGEVYFMTLLS